MSDRIADALAEAARTIGQAHDVEATLTAIVETARISMPAFQHIGISTIDRKGNIETKAATTDLVLKLDKLQYGVMQGPCVDTIHGAPIQVVPRIRQEQRWPRYVPEAVETMGLRSQLAVRLYLDDVGTVGGLNMYSTDDDEISESDVATADLFATHAALALSNARHSADLNKALESRTQIGIAIGTLMSQYHLNEGAAFAFLTRASSHSNVKLRDVAAKIVAEANRAAEDGHGGNPE